jgi:uncharacterized protein
MPLDAGLLELLACPLCRGELLPTDDARALRCPRCRVAFPVVDDIPDLLPESARPLDLAPKSP